MEIDKNYKRKIRIVGYHAEGWDACVFDAETGESITNITSLDIHLSVEDDNTVEVTHANPDATKVELFENDGCVLEKVTLDDPEIQHLEAYEAT